MTTKKPAKSKKQVRPILKKKSIQAFEAQIKKIYMTKLGVHVIVKKIASNGVQVVPEFSSKTLVVKRSSLLFISPIKKMRKKTLSHFKACVQQWGEADANKNSSIPAPAPTYTVRPFLLATSLNTPSPTQVRRGPKGPRNVSVSSIVDPMLFSGIYTRPQISTALGESEIGKTLSNRDMGWYTGYRIAVLKEKGYSFEQKEDATIRLFKTNLMKISDKIDSVKDAIFFRDKIAG